MLFICVPVSKNREKWEWKGHMEARRAAAAYTTTSHRIKTTTESNDACRPSLTHTHTHTKRFPVCSEDERATQEKI